MPAIGTMVKIESSPHVKVKMFDKNENTWDVVLPEAGDEAYYPRWTNDPDFLTHTGHGRYSKAFLCRFASDYKSIEKSVLFASGGSIYHPGARIGIRDDQTDIHPSRSSPAHAAKTPYRHDSFSITGRKIETSAHNQLADGLRDIHDHRGRALVRIYTH